jgi:tetratricopeptide (TPR) repeat protein
MKISFRDVNWKSFITPLVLGLILLTVIAVIELQKDRNDDNQNINFTDNYTAGLIHMNNGDYASAIESFEKQLFHLEQVPPHMVDVFFNYLARAHYLQGESIYSDNSSRAREHYLWAAVFFEQAANITGSVTMSTQAYFHQAAASLMAEDFSSTIDAGQRFFSGNPRQAIEEKLLPESCIGQMHEILNVAYMSLSHKVEDDQQDHYYQKGLDHAKKALELNPDQVIQPYYYLGVDSYLAGEDALAKEYINKYLTIMNQIPTHEWTDQDYEAFDHANMIATEVR